MKSKAVARKIILINQLILLLIITTFAMGVLAQPVNTDKKSTPIAKELKLAKGQPYVPPKKNKERCA